MRQPICGFAAVAMLLSSSRCAQPRVAHACDVLRSPKAGARVEYQGAISKSPGELYVFQAVCPGSGSERASLVWAPGARIEALRVPRLKQVEGEVLDLLVNLGDYQ